MWIRLIKFTASYFNCQQLFIYLISIKSKELNHLLTILKFGSLPTVLPKRKPQTVNTRYHHEQSIIEKVSMFVGATRTKEESRKPMRREVFIDLY